MIKLKICGITNLYDALFISSQGADALGFIFSKKSPRYVNTKLVKRVIDSLDPFLIKVGVFVNEDKQKVFDIASNLGLDAVQFHGQEKPAYCNFFKPKFKVIKVFFPQNVPLAKQVSKYNVDAYLFDIKYEDKLKGIKVLSFEALKEIKSIIKSGKRVIISGGLNLNNIAKIKKLEPYAVDVASGLENLVGKKDEHLVKEFIKKVKI